MLKTKAIYLQYAVTIPAYVSYDTDDEPADGVAYMVMSESDGDRFFEENSNHAIEQLCSLSDVVDAEYSDPAYGDHEERDFEYMPEVPMWTDYMPRHLLVQERCEKLKEELEYALDSASYDEAIRIVGELKRLSE